MCIGFLSIGIIDGNHKKCVYSMKWVSKNRVAWKDQDEVGHYAHPISKYWKQKVGSNN